MKTKFTLFCFFVTICAGIGITAKAQVDKQDSLALVDLYNSTNGPSWTNNSNWLNGTVNTWFGIAVDTGATGLRVRAITLGQNNLTGSIPATMGNLKRLSDLDLHKNKLSGSIPSSIGNLRNLVHLKLNNNQLSGSLPSTLGNLVQLKFLALSNNQFTGSIPAELGTLARLSELYLHQNQLSGSIPVELGNLDSLTILFLDHNQLSGGIPAELGNLNKLQTLRLQDNALSGSIPPEIANHFAVGLIDVKHNNFTFDGMELLAQQSTSAIYDHQRPIPVHLINDNLSVSAGGTLSNNTYSWYKLTATGNLRVAVITGDSIFHPTDTGRYFVKVNNSIASKLTLVSTIISYENTLPVTITDLKAYAQKHIITVDWTSVTEINVDRYEIQRSFNSVDFSSIGSLSAKGNGTLKADYTFNDLKPLAGSNYYRLKVIDKDGKVALSKIVLVVMNSDNLITMVYPIPAKNILHVELNGNASFSLLNQAGKVLLTTTINNKGSINVSGLTAGLYYLRNNSTKSVQKVVISR